MPSTLSRRAARLLPAAAALALITACPQPPPPDTTAPAPASLTVANITDTSLQLRWTAVGDDGTDGAATSYELRSLSGAACPITQANFATGTAVPGLGTPQAAGTAEAFNVTGLTGDTTYCFMLKVTDDSGNSSFSGAAVATTTDLVAPSRATLALANASDTAATISWTAVGDNGVSGIATTYEMRYLSGASCPINTGNFASGTAVTGLPAPMVPGTSQQVTVSGLASAVDYCFALKVSDEAGNNSLSNSLAVLTSDSVAPAAAVLSTGAATGTSIAVNWTAVGDDGTTGTATSYELRSATGAACPLTSATFASGTAVSGLPAPSPAGTSESFTVTGLASDKAYCFMLKVTDDSGNSSLSNSAAGSTLDVTAPAAAAITAGNATGTSVKVDWLAVGDDGSTGTATAYELRYSSGSACPLTPATFTGGTSVSGLSPPAAAGSAESFTVTGLGSDTAYCFMLKVTDDSGNSSFSNSSGTRTLDVTPPASPNLSAGVVAGTSIQVLWTAVGDDANTGTATSYDLRYRSGAACPITAANFAGATPVAGLGAPRAAGQPESFIVQGLASDTSYCFLLHVTDDAGNSAFSSSLTQSTPDVTPPASVSLNAAVFDTSFQFNWTAVGDDGTTGTATSQELRYLVGNACPIDSGNFASGTLAAGLGAPAAAGTPETFTVSGLSRETKYCFALKVADELGNASISNTFTATTPDTSPPDAAVLSTANPGARSIHVTWTAVGDDGATGTATSYELRYLSGGACPVTSGNFASGTLVATGAPQASGSAEDVTVSGLAQATTYCFALKVTDNAGNTSALSSSASGATLADTTPPGPVADLAVGTTSASTVQLTWTAPADDGSTAATGPATSYDLRYLSGAACPIDAGNFATGTPVPTGAPGAPGATETVSASGLAAGVSYCFLLQATDAVGNSSFSNSATGTTIDNSPPAAITDLTALGPDATGNIILNWTAVGAHGTVGTATSYDLRVQTGDCTGFNFSTATPVPGVPSPGPAGVPESFTFTGASFFSQYCFGLQVSNSIPTSSLSNSALAGAGASAQIAAIRQLIHDASASPVTLSAAVQGAIVTYRKATVNGRPPGIQDGPGFFIQNDNFGPALFFAVDPDVVLPGMAAGDKVNLSVTEGAWMGCQSPPCDATNSMYVVTQATATPVASGVTLPAVQDLTFTVLPLPLTNPFDYEHELVKATGTIGAISTAGAGFERATLATPGTSSTFQEFRFTDAVMVAKGVANGCTVTVNNTPMWRFGPFAQFSAWAPGEVTLSGCPAPTLVSTNPLDAATGVDPATTIDATFDQPMTQASMNGQAGGGLCSGTIQLSGDNFATCVPFTASAATLSNNNTQATLTPTTTLKGTGAYKIRVTNAATSANGGTIGATVTQGTGFTVAGGTCISISQVVISQFYGGGGNSGAQFHNDYVELHNRGPAPVSLAGWSLQYNSATTNNAWLVAPLSSVTNPNPIIAPGGYWLVQLAAGAGGGATLPTPDLVTSGGAAINMSATTGRIALMAQATAMPAGTTCPVATVVDFIGYGASLPLCAEGTQMAALSNTTAGFRANATPGPDSGCTDTNNNATDLSTGVPVPRNSATGGSNTCTCP